MTIEKAKEIVAKMLQRTTENGCTDSEAKAAIARAHELLAKFNLSMSELDVEDKQIVESRVETDTKSLSAIQVTIALALAEHFGVALLRVTHSNGTSLKVVAEKVKVDVFTETFLFAYKSFKFNWSKYAKTLDCSTHDKSAHRGTYLKGFCDGFTNEIIRNENEFALVVSKSNELMSYMAKNHSCNSTAHYGMRTSGDYEAYGQGYSDGGYAQRSRNKVVTD